MGKEVGLCSLIISLGCSCALTIPWIVVFKDAANLNDSTDTLCRDTAKTFVRFVYYFSIV